MNVRTYPYFKTYPLEDGSPAPAPLSCSVERTARFEEVDPLNIVWHGRYPSYLEDARVAFGDAYGLGYLDFYRHGIAVPVKQLYIDYAAPLHFRQVCRITATLHWNDAARLNFSYRITDQYDAVLTTAYTVQLFVGEQHGTYMFKPDFYAAFCERWKAGNEVHCQGGPGQKQT